MLPALENAKKARASENLDQLRLRLIEMEQAATLIGQAMLRRP